jgi:hypothetical protein
VDQLSYKLLCGEDIDENTDLAVLDTKTETVSYSSAVIQLRSFYWAACHIRKSKEKRDELKLC